MAAAHSSATSTLRSRTGTESGSSVAVNQRVLSLLAGFRLLIALGMLLAVILAKQPMLLGERLPDVFLANAAVYFAAAVAIGLLVSLSGWPAANIAIIQLPIDIICIVTAGHASGGISSGLETLLVVFVAGGALSFDGRLAYLSAALASLAVLAEQSLSFLQQQTPAADFLSAGMLGAIMLVIAAATRPLVRRIRETEELARQRGVDLANLAQLNEYIIQNLRESIVVVDELNRVRLINQSAADRLGLERPRREQPLAQISPALCGLLRIWRDGQGPSGSAPPTFTAADGSTLINTHFAALGGGSDGPVLMFLEDASLIEERIQQTKLAALGRLSASIAHEIRNPVGAVSHANQLLAESAALGDEERRFVSIIQTNTRRVSDIVENILQLSRRGIVDQQMISLRQWTTAFVQEFLSTLELFEGQLTVLQAEEDIEVRMDPTHLHQVAWNLCENAVKYASESAGGIAVELRYGRQPGTRRPLLEIIDHGAGVPEDMRDTLFEPFATGPRGGTGLGLYICRELCERNRASLRYKAGETGGSIFQIVFADPKRWEATE